MPDQKTCFVVMGFNKKTDYATGRTLDLNKTYRNIIKPAVEAAGVTCVRADEIVHSGVIDVPMYEQLLEADLVVADISTMNPNALYELGVRHALRPFTTIVMGESRIFEKGYPFDLSHLLIRSYVHLGDGIDFDEVEARRKELTEAVQTILAAPKHDSPVVREPGRPRAAAEEAVAKQIAAAVAGAAPRHRPPRPAMRTACCSTTRRPPCKSDFDLALRSFRAARSSTRRMPTSSSASPSRPTRARSRRRQRARGRTRGPEGAHPETSNDPETLGLWGAVHKRLFDLTASGRRSTPRSSRTRRAST